MDERCILPMGVLEKHGDHLPLGQDTIYASMAPRPGLCSTPLIQASNNGHTGEVDASAMVHLHPQLVRLDFYRDYRRTLGRLSHLKEVGLSTAIWWYADHPGHLQDDQVSLSRRRRARRS